MTGKGNNKLLIWVLLLAVVLVSFLNKMVSFNRTPYAVGRDAYFHVIQARSLLEDGKTHAPDSSLTPYFFVASYKLTGDWESAQKLLLGLMTALYTFLAYLVGMQLFRQKGEGSRRNWSLLLALVLSVSPTLSHLASQYLKQLIGMTAFMGFLWTMLWNLRKDEEDAGQTGLFLQQAARRSLMLIMVIVAVFAHRLSGVMAFIGLVFALPWAWILAGGGLGVVLVILGSLVMPGILSVFDLERLQGLLTISPSFHPVSISRLLYMNPGWFAEMLLPYVFIFALVFQSIWKKRVHFRREQWYLLTLLLAALFPFFQYKSLDFGFRLFIAVIPLFPILYLSFVDDTGDFYIPGNDKVRSWFFAGWAVLLLPFSFITFRPQDMLPYTQYKGVIQRAEKVLAEKQPEIVILHHGFSFYYTYVSNRHTLPFVPDWDVEDTDVYRIAFRIPKDTVNKYLPWRSFQPVILGDDYTLFREDDWQRMLSNSQGDEHIQFRMKNPKNPYEKRPSYLAQHQEHVSKSKVEGP